MIHFTQLNLHKAKMAAIDLHSKLQCRNDVALLTEPYIARGKIVGLPTGYAAFLANNTAGGAEGTSTCRAAILIPRGMTAVKIDRLCHGDCIVVMLTTANSKFMLASIYLDINKEVNPEWLQQVVTYADSLSLIHI